jgi:ankyrin repeat protein
MDGKTALFLAVHKNKTALVLQLLRALEGTSDTALLNKKYTSGESYYSATCLHLAAEKNNPQIVEALLGAGASINELDVYGKTALCVAAEQGNTEIVRMLLARGADIYAPRDRSNCSTLNIVSSRCYLSEDTAQNAEQRPIIQKLIRDQQRALQ